MHFVESYRRFTSLPTPVPEVFGVKAFIERMVHLAQHQHSAQGIRFSIAVQPADLLLYADEKLISQVMTNLLKNAIQAIGEQKATTYSPSARAMKEASGELNIRAYSNEAEAVVIEISNSGQQIPAEIAAHIFIPFFSTKPQGNGIGLSISRQIMRLSQGHLRLLPGIPTTFQLTFD